MYSRFPKKLTLEEQRKLASPTDADKQEKRNKNYGQFGETFKQAGNCFGNSCGAYRDLRAEYVDPHLDTLSRYLGEYKEDIGEKMAECVEYTGDEYDECAASVKETVRNAAEAAGDVARNAAVGAHAAMIRTLPPSVQTNINVSKRLDAEKKEFDNEIRKRDKQYPVFQLFVWFPGKRRYTLEVQGNQNIFDIKQKLQEKGEGEYNFNSFIFKARKYNVDADLENTTLLDLHIKQDNEIIITSGGMKKTKKRRKSTTTTKRRKIIRRRKGTKRRV